MPLEDIKAKIVSLCRQHWDTYGTAYLTSKLGLDLREDKFEIQRLTGKKLLDFIRSDMNEQVRAERWPGHPNIWGLFPHDALLSEEDIGFYFPQRSPASTSPDKPPRYDPRFWAAFSIPIEDGHRRYLDLRGRPEFHDVSGNASPPPGTVEVEPNRIPSPECSNRAAEIIQGIRGWAEMHKVDAEQFTINALRRPWPSGNTSMPRRTTFSGSVLHLMVDSLSEQELREISLPLNVVAKLLRRAAR